MPGLHNAGRIIYEIRQESTSRRSYVKSLICVSDTKARLLKKLLTVFTVFFKIGLFTFGGGLEMLPLFKKELVEKHNWITGEKLLDAISISQSIPGSLTINSAAFLGREIAGVCGALVAIFGASLAPVLCITVVIIIHPWIDGNVHVENFFAGVRAAVVGLILNALLDLRRHVLRIKADYIIMAGAFIAIEVLKIHFVYVIIAGIICSLFLHYLSQKKYTALAVVLLVNLAVSLCNIRAAYIFWAIPALAGILIFFDMRKA